MTYAVDRVVVGGSDTEFFGGRGVGVPDFLPPSASLAVRVPQFSSPGTIRTKGVTVAAAPFSNQTIRPSSLTLDGGGIRWLNERDPNDVFSGRAYIGSLGNTGVVEVLNGAVFNANSSIYLGGGSSRPFPGKPVIEIGDGTLIVSGHDTNGLPSSVSTRFLAVGSGDFDRDEPLGYSDIQVKVGTVLIDDEGQVSAEAVVVGDTDRFGLFANSRVNLGLPGDTITVAGGNQFDLKLSSRLSVESDFTLGIESVLDVAVDTQNDFDGGIATIGFVSEERIHSLETVSVGPGGWLDGIGTIRGRVVQSGGVVSPGFSPGILTIDGDYEALGGTIRFEVFGEEPGAGYDQFVINGNAIVGGEVQIRFGDFTPQPGAVFELFKVGGSLSAPDLRINFVDAPTELIPNLSFSNGQLFVVPEPTSLFLVLLGSVWLGSVRRPSATYFFIPSNPRPPTPHPSTCPAWRGTFR